MRSDVESDLFLRIVVDQRLQSAPERRNRCQVNFVPQQPLVVDTFKSCEGLSRIAFLDGNGVVPASAASNLESIVLREG